MKSNSHEQPIIVNNVINIQKKLFIISFNQFSIEFWKERINLDCVDYWHWKSPELAINNLTTIFPDIIIVDGYWAKESYQPYLERIIGENGNSKIFCITPEEPSEEKLVSIDGKVKFSNLNSQVLEEINELIMAFQFKNNLKLNQTA